jgi:hypothetical protein
MFLDSKIDLDTVHVCLLRRVSALVMCLGLSLIFAQEKTLQQCQKKRQTKKEILSEEETFSCLFRLFIASEICVQRHR